MNLLTLLTLKDRLSTLRIDSDPESIHTLLESVGFKDRSLTEGVLVAIKAVSSDPSETLQHFIEGGGLLRLLAGKRSGEESEEGVVPIQCPHCDEFIFIGSLDP